VDTPALQLTDVTVVRDGRAILDGVTLDVAAGQRWVVLGRNGSGKTTLVRVASLMLHPTAGEVRVLGERLGRTDVRALRTRIGIVSASLADQLRPGLTAEEVVRCGIHAALEPWWHSYTDADTERAVATLERTGCGRLAGHTFATLSSGERQRVMLARTLITDPGLLLLDEPCAGLDLGGREELVGSLAALAADPAAAPVVLVTHHVEEIPPGFTHVLLLRDGQVAAAGPLEATLTAAALSECFGLAVTLERRGDRWSAAAA
jgi:iron complex transport system ATP-binding protein